MEQEIKKLESAIEAILFAMGKAVTVSQIAAAIEHDTDTTRKLLHHLMDVKDQCNRNLYGYS